MSGGGTDSNSANSSLSSLSVSESKGVPFGCCDGSNGSIVGWAVTIVGTAASAPAPAPPPPSPPPSSPASSWRLAASAASSSATIDADEAAAEAAAEELDADADADADAEVDAEEEEEEEAVVTDGCAPAEAVEADGSGLWECLLSSE